LGLCRVGRDWRVTRALLVQLRLCRAMLQSGAQSSKIRSRICGQVAVWTIGRLEHAITEPHRKRRVTEQLSQLQSPRSENLTAKHSRLRRPCTAPPVIASYNNRRCHNKNKNVKKMSQHFFSWSRPGCDRPFFRSYRRSEILFYFCAVLIYDVRYGGVLAFLVFIGA